MYEQGGTCKLTAPCALAHLAWLHQDSRRMPLTASRYAAFCKHSSCGSHQRALPDKQGPTFPEVSLVWIPLPEHGFDPLAPTLSFSHLPSSFFRACHLHFRPLFSDGIALHWIFAAKLTFFFCLGGSRTGSVGVAQADVASSPPAGREPAGCCSRPRLPRQSLGL